MSIISIFGIMSKENVTVYIFLIKEALISKIKNFVSLGGLILKDDLPFFTFSLAIADPNAV